MKLSRLFVAAFAALILVGVTAMAHADQIQVGSQLTITAGVGGGTSTSMPGTGSKFSMDAFGNGNLVWTVLSAGSQTDTYLSTPSGITGGIIVGTTQSDGGQMTTAASNSTPGQIDAAWKFFGSYGTDFTYPGVGGVSGDTANYFAWSTCTSGLGTTQCGSAANGFTALGAWNVSWNGTNNPLGVPMGGGVIDAWIVGAGGTTYTLDYRQTVPSTSPAFPGVPYGLHLEGNIVPNVPEPASLLLLGTGLLITGTVVRRFIKK